ncbi:MAG: hypothetical protein ACJ73D_05215 [Pyrinomonadaceae bacterium]
MANRPRVTVIFSLTWIMPRAASDASTSTVIRDCAAAATAADRTKQTSNAREYTD